MFFNKIMVLTYTNCESLEEPVLIDTTTSKSKVYIRKDVEIEVRGEGEEEHVVYKFKQAKLSKEDYDKYLEEINAGTVMSDVSTLKETTNIISEKLISNDQTMRELSTSIDTILLDVIPEILGTE